MCRITGYSFTILPREDVARQTGDPSAMPTLFRLASDTCQAAWRRRPSAGRT
jgi:hypothetical protein